MPVCECLSVCTDSIDFGGHAKGYQSRPISRLTRSGATSALSGDVSLNGLNRHSAALSWSSRGRTALSVPAVMKMTKPREYVDHRKASPIPSSNCFAPTLLM
jgi:hypothetical protein